MNNENCFEDLISEEITEEDQATIAGGTDLGFGIVNSLLGNSILMKFIKIDFDINIINISDSFNFGGNKVE